MKNLSKKTENKTEKNHFSRGYRIEVFTDKRQNSFFSTYGVHPITKK